MNNFSLNLEGHSIEKFEALKTPLSKDWSSVNTRQECSTENLETLNNDALKLEGPWHMHVTQCFHI